VPSTLCARCRPFPRVQDWLSSLIPLPWHSEEDYLDGRTSGPAGVDLAATNNGKVSSAPKLSSLKLWLTLPLPTILEVTSATLGVATDEVLLGGMSAADIEECRF